MAEECVCGGGYERMGGIMGCTSCYSVCDSLCVCLGGDITDTNIFGHLVVEAGNATSFYSAYRGLRRALPAVRGLVKAFKAYDLPQWVSTHSGMTRRIARLRKLLRLLKGVVLEIEELSGLCFASYAELARPVMDLLEEELGVLEYFRDKPHRIRDRVHAFLYPVILSALDALVDVELVLWPSSSPGGYRYYYSYTHDRGLSVHVEGSTCTVSRRIEEGELEALAREEARSRDPLSNITWKRIHRWCTRKHRNPDSQTIEQVLRWLTTR